jgi:beta-galactosidase beta subunit
MEHRVEPRTKTITVRVTPEEYKRVVLLKLESHRKIRDIVIDAVNREWAEISRDDALTPEEEYRMAEALAEYRAGLGEGIEDVRRQLLDDRDD